VRGRDSNVRDREHPGRTTFFSFPDA